MGFCWFLEIIPMIPTVPGHYGRWRSSFGREPPEIGMAGHQAEHRNHQVNCAGTASRLLHPMISHPKKHDISKTTWNLKKQDMTSPPKYEIKKQKHEIPKKSFQKTWNPKKHEFHPKKHEIKNKKNMKSHYIPLIPIQFTLNHPALWLARSRWRDHVAISSGNRGCLVVLVTASSNHGYS